MRERGSKASAMVAAAVVAIAAAAGPARAAIGVVWLGTEAPPAIVPAGDAAGLPATFAPLDTRPLFTDETAVSFTPLTGLSFSAPMNHRRVGEGWATWSHGYTGDVYRNYSSEGDPYIMTLISPAGFDYFAFYAEPGPFTELDITALGVDSTGASIFLTQPVHGMAGASGWAFYATGGTHITSITVTIEGGGFATGEYSYHERVPGPASLSGLVIGAVMLRGRSRRAG